MIEMSLQHDEPVTIPVRSFGKLVRSMAGYTILAALMVISPLVVFMPAALFHCGIRNGRRAAWTLLVLASAAVALVAWPAAHAASVSDAWLSYAQLLGVILSIGVPAVAVLPLVQRGETFGRVLIMAVLIGFGGLMLTEVATRAASGVSPYAAHVADTRQSYAAYTDFYRKAGVPAESMQSLMKVLEIGTLCITAALVCTVATIFILSLVMHGRLELRRALAAAPGVIPVTPYRFRNLSMPDWLLFGFVIGGIAPLVTGVAQQIAANVLAVVLFLYLLQGLAIVRHFIGRTGAGLFGSIFAWSLIVLLSMAGIGLLLLTVVGLFDPFFDFRHINRKDHSDESHSH
jgi:hypothetical protein